MLFVIGPELFAVHCHIGSLENKASGSEMALLVHCHIGSLEINEIIKRINLEVHCRIGSLERLGKNRTRI